MRGWLVVLGLYGFTAALAITLGRWDRRRAQRKKRLAREPIFDGIVQHHIPCYDCESRSLWGTLIVRATHRYIGTTGIERYYCAYHAEYHADEPELFILEKLQ